MHVRLYPEFEVRTPPRVRIGTPKGTDMNSQQKGLGHYMPFIINVLTHLGI